MESFAKYIPSGKLTVVPTSSQPGLFGTPVKVEMFPVASTFLTSLLVISETYIFPCVSKQISVGVMNEPLLLLPAKVETPELVLLPVLPEPPELELLFFLQEI